jgi:hypothetical protein
VSRWEAANEASGASCEAAARRRDGDAAGAAARPCAGHVSHLLLEVATNVLPGSAATPSPGDSDL